MSRRSSLATRPSAERTPAAPGTSTVSAELLGERTGVQRAGASVGDEREVARIVAALDRDDAQSAEHLRVDDVDDGGRVDLAERAGRGVGVEVEPSGSRCGRRPRSRFASVTVGSAPPRP